MKGKTVFNWGWGWVRDERGRLAAAGCACGALLVVALLLPLTFRTPAQGGAAASVNSPAEARAALFVAFWYGAEDGGEEIRIAKTEKTEPDAVTAAFCQEQMAALTARCIDDRALSSPAPTGSEYTTVTGRDGTVLSLCRMWLQATGDWQNLLDVCFDTEDGRIYYFYVSRESLTNRNLYAYKDRPDWAAAAAALAENAGGRLRHFSENSAGGAAVIETPEGTLCYQITGAYFDALIDVRINCV